MQIQVYKGLELVLGANIEGQEAHVFQLQISEFDAGSSVNIYNNFKCSGTPV